MNATNLTKPLSTPARPTTPDFNKTGSKVGKPWRIEQDDNLFGGVKNEEEDLASRKVNRMVWLNSRQRDIFAVYKYMGSLKLGASVITAPRRGTYEQKKGSPCNAMAPLKPDETDVQCVYKGVFS